MTIGIALLGAGIFAREEHLPAISKNAKVELKAIYSRSEKSSQQLADQVESPIDVYFDCPARGGNSLDDLLQRPDIEAVIICLPITVQAEVTKKALASGKHVLSEKPIAADVERAKDLIQFRQQLSSKPVWLVAENFRFLDAIAYGHSKVKEIGGDLVTFHTNVFTLVDEKDKFYQTEWRQVPDYQGGFLLDGGVHFIAGLRYLLRALGQDITSLAGYTALVQPKLAPVDTVHAVLATNSGRSGWFSVSFGAAFESGFEIVVVTTKGRVSVTPTVVSTIDIDAAGQKRDQTKEFEFSSGVAAELDAFADSINTGTADARATPEQALKDILIIQSMLESGVENGASKQILA